MVPALQPTWLIGRGRAHSCDQPFLRQKGCPITCRTLQEDVDDFVRDEGEDLEGANERDLAAMYKRQAEYRQQEPEMTAEDLEEYVKNRFQKPGAYDVGDQDVDAGGVKTFRDWDLGFGAWM